jgi:hypothetical protein
MGMFWRYRLLLYGEDFLHHFLLHVAMCNHHHVVVVIVILFGQNMAQFNNLGNLYIAKKSDLA